MQIQRQSLNSPLFSKSNITAPLQSNVSLGEYESGAAWYFSNANTRSYTGYFARVLDWLGRKLSFLHDASSLKLLIRCFWRS
jgi:hypothetical protein